MSDSQPTYDLDDEEYSKENLPALCEKAGLPEAPELPWRVGVRPPPLPAPVDADTELEKHLHDDLNQINHHLVNSSKMFKAITSVDDFCKLTLTCTKLLEIRRKAANKQWGQRETKEAFSGIPKDIEV